MNREQFLTELSRVTGQRYQWAHRELSSRESNPLSYQESGWIVAQQLPNGIILLYDSIQNYEKYMAHCRAQAWLVGRHDAATYSLIVKGQEA